MRSRTSLVRIVLVLGVLAAGVNPAIAQGHSMGPLAQKRAALSSGVSPVIVRAIDHSSLPLIAAAIQQRGGVPGRQLPIIDAVVATLPNAAIAALAGDAPVGKVSLDRQAFASMERTGATVGATTVRQDLGLDGTGVGVAIIDSGITSWHDDLMGLSGGQRVNRFVDILTNRTVPSDDYGHGTHVAGIVAGNGHDSSGARTGIAPGASLVVVKALDGQGRGRISDLIAAMDYVLANRNALNIRVVNLSVSAGVFESYDADPLTLAAKRLVDAGIVVVAAAGNAGRDGQDHTQYGSITAPGNAPWVLTVGAANHMGTADRLDDTMAVFSSRGPTAWDYTAKPDVVAPGVGIESLSDPQSAFYTSKAAYLLSGTVSTTYLPYLSLSGTSMATPVVTGTVALMMQANPALTPNAVKAILQYTAHIHPHYNRLTQGVGFLNAKGAVELARYLSAPTQIAYPTVDEWSRELIWGNHLVRGGVLTAAANAWSTDVTWGAPFTPSGETVRWGAWPGTGAMWGTSCVDLACTTIQWGTGLSRNVVWGNTCQGADCSTTWTMATAGSAVTTTSEDDIVVWGSTTDGIVVWGSTEAAIVVWGSTVDGIVVWGSSDDDIVVWGSTCTACEPVVWGR